MMRISGIVAAAAAAALVASCGAEDDGSGSTPSVGTATFTGAVTGGLSEVVIAIESDQSTSTPTTFVFSGASSGITFSTSIELNTGTFTLSDTGYTSANTSIVEGGVEFNSMNYGLLGGSTAATEGYGTFTLNITNNGTVHTLSGVNNYFGVHGTLTGSYVLNNTAGATAANVSIVF